MIINSLSLEQLLTRFGVSDQSITSGPNKAILSPTRSLTAEQRTILQSLVDQLYGRFVKLIVEGRGLDEAQVRKLADGRLYTAQEALAEKLIDRIGYREEAMAELTTLAGGGPFNIVRYSVRPSFIESLGGAVRTPRIEERIFQGALAAPRPFYLYAPFGIHP